MEHFCKVLCSVKDKHPVGYSIRIKFICKEMFDLGLEG